MIVQINETVYDMPVTLFDKTIEIALEKILRGILYIV